MNAVEINFDGLVGPTHNFAGLATGNLASEHNRDRVSNPRAAALEGIRKMRRLAELGLPQGVLPPHARPDIDWLRSLGFCGTDAEVWERAWREERALARAAVDTSSMWVANAATVSPSADCGDGRLHLSVANLHTMLHRCLEAGQTERALRKLLPDESRFVVHPALPAHAALADEGAANHMRLSIGGPGIEVLVYGRTAEESPQGFPARQTLEASRALARRHLLDPHRTLFVRQSRVAIDAGCFHNDVVAVAHENVVFYHEHAFAGPAELVRELREKTRGLLEPVFVQVPAAAVPLEDAVSSYLFNSQLVRTPGAATLTLVAPTDVRDNAAAAEFVERMTASPDAPIGEVEYVEIRESMRGGGGPACLRLRIAMTPDERAAANPGFLLDDELAGRLEAWVRRHYRDRLTPDDLGDPRLIDEMRAALDELTRVLPLGADFYPFQR